MKKNRFVALILSVLLLITMSVSAVSAASIWGMLGLDDIDIDSIFSGIGNGGTVKLSDLLSGDGLDAIREVLGGAADGASDSALSAAIKEVLGGNSALGGDISDLLNSDTLQKLTDYLAGEDTTAATENTTGAIITTEPATEEPTTAAPTTEESTTAAPTTQQTTTYVYTPTVYSGAQTYTATTYTYVTEASTAETTTYTYVPTVSESVAELVPTDFTPVVYDNDDGASDGISAKMVIGIVILVISGGAVVAVAIILKKSRV